MREFHSRATHDGVDAGTDAEADVPGRHAGDNRQLGGEVVQSGETRTALALGYRHRVEIVCAASGSEDCAPTDDQGRRSPAATGTDGNHPAVPAEHDADSRNPDSSSDPVKPEDKTERATRSADLPPRARDLPNARDILPNIRMAELDSRKLEDYSLNPGHPGNEGKANGWRALGYDVDNAEERRDVAQELRGLICDELLARGKVANTRETPYGPSYQVLNGITGPNGRHATLVTCWQIQDRAGLNIPRLSTVWVEPHRDKETNR